MSHPLNERKPKKETPPQLPIEKVDDQPAVKKEIKTPTPPPRTPKSVTPVSEEKPILPPKTPPRTPVTEEPIVQNGNHNDSFDLLAGTTPNNETPQIPTVSFNIKPRVINL